MVNKILAILLLITPIVYGTNINMDKFDTLLFIFSAIALFIATFFDKPKREVPKRIGYLMASLVAIASINVCWHSFHPAGISTLLNIFLSVFILNIILRYAEYNTRLYKFILYATLINITVFALQKINFHPIINPDVSGFSIDKAGGIMGNAPRLLDYLVITFPLFGVPTVILYSITSIMTKEYTLLGIVTIVLLLKTNNWPRKIVVLIVMGITLLLLYERILFSLITTRWPVWKPTIEVICKRPLLGYGLGIFPFISKQFCTFTGQQVDYTFNSYLQFIFEVGIVFGIGWFVFAIKELIKRFDYSAEAFCILSMLIISTLEYPFQIPKLWFTIIFLVGMFVIKTNKEEIC